LETMKCKTKP